MAARDELLDLHAIADRYGVAYNTAWRWSRRPDFPAVAKRLGNAPGWRRADVEEWATKHRPQPGRPRRGK